MTPEDRVILRDIYERVEENNKILRSIRRTSRFTAIMRSVYWILILGTAFGAYYFIQPYIKTLTSAYGQVLNISSTVENSGLNGTNSIPNDAEKVKKLIDLLGN